MSFTLVGGIIVASCHVQYHVEVGFIPILRPRWKYLAKPQRTQRFRQWHCFCTKSRTCVEAQIFMRVPLFNLFEAGSVYLALFFYPRLRSLRSLSLVFLRIKPRRGFSAAAGNHHLGSRTGINPARRLCAALVVCAVGCVP